MLQLNFFVVAVLALCLPLLTWAECYSQRYSLIPPAKQPPYLNCGTKGRLRDPTSIATLSAPRLEQCVQACKNSTAYTTKTCISLGYSPSNATCTLYDRRLIEQDFKDRGQNFGTKFYNKRCFSCEPCPTGELVKNGGFQIEGLDGPTSALHWSQLRGAKRELGTMGSDNYTMLFDDDGSYAVISQEINCMTPGQPYIFSALFNSSIAVRLDGHPVHYEFSCDGTCGDFPRATATVTPKHPTPTLYIENFSTSIYIMLADDISLKLAT